MAMVFLRILSLLFFPAVLSGQFVTDDSDGFYRRLYEDGREAILVQYFLEGQPIEIGLEMVQNTCSGETEPFSCRMIIPREKRILTYIWTKHPDPEKIGRFANVGGGMMAASLLDHMLWGQLGPGLPNELRKDISLICGRFDWMPSGDDSKEEVDIQAVAFQGDFENGQLLNSVSAPQYTLLLGPALAVLADDGNYHLTGIENLSLANYLGLANHISMTGPPVDIVTLRATEMMEFIFKTADSSICQTVFSTQSLIYGAFPQNIKRIPRILVHKEGESYHIEFPDRITPVVVDKEGDIQQNLYPHSFR